VLPQGVCLLSRNRYPINVCAAVNLQNQWFIGVKRTKNIKNIKDKTIKKAAGAAFFIVLHPIILAVITSNNILCKKSK
jgi:hypothetical protein